MPASAEKQKISGSTRIQTTTHADLGRRAAFLAKQLRSSALICITISLTHIVGRVFQCPEPTGWICARDTMEFNSRDRRLIYPKRENGRLRVKVFMSELKSRFMGFPRVITEYSTSDGTMEVREIFGSQLFSLIDQATTEESLVLDSFAGSGTTGHAVLALNKQDGGNRRFILVEMEEGICRSITAQRLTRAVDGYASRAVASISDRREERQSETAATDTTAAAAEERMRKSAWKAWAADFATAILANSYLTRPGPFAEL